MLILGLFLVGLFCTCYRLYDIVVDTPETQVSCLKHMKSKILNNNNGFLDF